MKRGFRMLMAALCSVVFLCGFSVTAYAGGGDEYMDYETEPVVETEPATEPEPAPTIEPGAGFAEEGNLVTRDLLYDEHTNKQFITVQTAGGNTFYIVIDYDKPVDEDGEQYQTYFLNTVDEADLLAAAEAAGVELASCSCSDKCAAGAVNTDCAVCAVNMTECAGVEQKPEPEPEPVAEPDAEPETEKGNAGMLLLVLAVAVLGGGEYAAPNSRRQQSRRRTTARNWRTMTARRTARPGMRTRTKTRIRRTGNEFHSKLF